MVTKNKLTSLFCLLGIYFIFSFSTLGIWEHYHLYPVTGDEPHYLIMASGIIKNRVFEQTIPYKREFKRREIFPYGLAERDATPSPMNTHGVIGPHGLFNVHNIGLPLILAIPFFLGGTLAAKIALVIMGSFAIIIAWKITACFSNDPNIRFFTVLATTVTLPLIAASHQIYPDILAGIISLSGLYWIMSSEKKRSTLCEFFWASVIVFLPWLHIRLVPVSLILIFGISIKIYARLKNAFKVFKLLLLALFSYTMLLAYNTYAFGSVWGPYQEGVLQVNKTALMVFLGLHLDQNQGFLLQNPVLLVGIFSILGLFFYNKYLTLIGLLLFFSLIVPNALCSNWYGGGSFSGRLAWAGGIVFILPTIFGLVKLASISIRNFQFIIGSGILLQLYFFYKYALDHVNLYNKGYLLPFPLSETYSIFYSPIHTWMPAFCNVAWAYHYAPNFIWIGLFFGLFVLGLIYFYPVPLFFLLKKNGSKASDNI